MSNTPLDPRRKILRGKRHLRTFPIIRPDYLRPTPMIKMWVDWVLTTAERPQPELALLAACVGIGGIIGRGLTWRNSHANIYGLGLASSASGKDAPLHSVAEAYKAAGFADLLGASRMDRDGGILKAITLKNSIVWPLDEVGYLFENMNKDNCPAGVRDIMQYLLELYSCKPHAGIEARRVPRVPIPAPFPCILSFTQPETFAGIFRDQMAESGFMGRFIPFLGEDLPPLNIEARRDPPPDELVRMLRMTRKVFRKNDITKGTTEIYHTTHHLGHHAKAAAIIDSKTQEMKELDRVGAALHARALEKAQKLALIHAWSLNPEDPVMTNESIDWGVHITEYSDSCMRWITRKRTTNVVGLVHELLYQMILKAGKEGILRNPLRMKSKVDALSFKLGCATLLNERRIVLVEGKTKLLSKFIAVANLDINL